MPPLPSVSQIVASTTEPATQMFNAFLPYSYFEIGIALAVILLGFIVAIIIKSFNGFTHRVSGGRSIDGDYNLPGDPGYNPSVGSHFKGHGKDVFVPPGGRIF